MRVGDGTRDGQILTDTQPTGRKVSTGEKKAATPVQGVEEGPSPFAKILHGLGREVDRGETLMKKATNGGGGQDLGNGELLALQAGVYRYSEAVDLSAKLVDRATSGVKTVLQGQ